MTDVSARNTRPRAKKLEWSKPDGDGSIRAEFFDTELWIVPDEDGEFFCGQFDQNAEVLEYLGYKKTEEDAKNAWQEWADRRIMGFLG